MPKPLDETNGKNLKKTIDLPLKSIISDNKKSIFEDLTIEDIEWLQQDILSLAEEDYKIVSLSNSQKRDIKLWETIEWRKKEKDFHGVIYIQKDLTPEETNPDKKAYVKEFIEWVENEFIGAQKFNLAAIDKLWLRNKLFQNYEEFTKYIDQRKNKNKSNNQWFLKKYFSKDNKIVLSGYWNPIIDMFYGMGKLSGFWLWDGSNVSLHNHFILNVEHNPNFCFSVRLKKSI